MNIWKNIVCAIMFAVAFVVPPLAHAQDDDETLLKAAFIKAAFIGNFIKLVEWPQARAISARKEISVCVIGETPVTKTGRIFQDASTPALTIHLISVDNGANARSCHIVFLADTLNSDKLKSDINMLKDAGVLTVSDARDFVDNGGMIGFVFVERKIKIEVNNRALTASGLRIDAQVLELALKVIR